MKASSPGRKDQPREANPSKALDALFYDPPKLKGLTMPTKLTELQQQIDALQKERNELLEREKFEAIEQINALIKTYSIKASELGFGEATQMNRFNGKVKGKVEAKYKSGNQTWTGRGRKPKWVEDHLQTGGSLDDLLIQ